MANNLDFQHIDPQNLQKYQNEDDIMTRIIIANTFHNLIWLLVVLTIVMKALQQQKQLK